MITISNAEAWRFHSLDRAMMSDRVLEKICVYGGMNASDLKKLRLTVDRIAREVERHDKH